MVLYPLGEQDFHNLRTGGYLYVDKTRYIGTLITNRYYFLSRPRRFGKSLFLSTLEQFFLGNRELFKGLAVDSLEWNWERYPVIRIDLSSGSYSQPGGLNARLWRVLNNIEKQYDVSGKGEYPGDYFDSLIAILKEKYNKEVVILIDEYEKPLLDTLYSPHHERYIDELRDFYSILKDNTRNIRFLFITGATRFGHLNIFSGLNNLTDISLSDEFAAICGITQEELTENFTSGIQMLAEKKKISPENAVLMLKEYYDGYHFSGQLIDIYNPYSLLNCLRFSRFADKWFQSGSSSYLIKKLKENRFDFTKLDGIKASEGTLLGLDSSFNNSVTLLYQSGYLTIKEFDEENDVYTLGLPNREVSEALFSAIIPFYLGSNKADREDVLKFIDLLQHGEAEAAMKRLQGYFSSIPYDVKLDYESDFQSILYGFFAHIGMLSKTTLEKQTSDGRIDMVLEMKDYVYVFEFKRGDNAEKALEQINSKSYALQWEGSGKAVIKIGIAFSPEKRNISSFIIQ